MRKIIRRRTKMETLGVRLEFEVDEVDAASVNTAKNAVTDVTRFASQG